MEFGNISQGVQQFFQSSPLLPHHEAQRQEINPQMASVRNGPGPGPGENPYPFQSPFPHTYNPPTDHLHHPNHPNLHYQPPQQQWTNKPVQNPHPPSYYAPPAQAQPQYRPERFTHVYHHPEPVYYAPPPPEHRLPYAPPSNPPPHSAQVPPEVRGVSDPQPARPLPPAPRLPEKREMTRTEFYRQYKQQESLKQRLSGPMPTKPTPQSALTPSTPTPIPPPPPPQERPPVERFIRREENAYWQPPPMTRSVPTWSYTPPSPAPTPLGPAPSPLPSQTRYIAEPPSPHKTEAPLDLSVRSSQPPEPLRRPWGDIGAPPPQRFPYPEPLKPVWSSQNYIHRPQRAPAPFRMPTVDFAPNFSQEVLRYQTPVSTAVRAPPVATVSATVRDLPAAPPRSISAAQVQPQQRYREFSVGSNKLNNFPTQFPPSKQQQQRPVGVALVSVKPPPQQQPNSELNEKFPFGGRKAALSPILTQKFRTKAELKQMTPLYNSSKSYLPTTPRLLTADDPLSAWRNACLKRSQEKIETPPDGVKNLEGANAKLKSREEDESVIREDSDEDKKEIKKEVEVMELDKSKTEEKSGEKETERESEEEEDAFDRLFSNQCQELESDLALQSFNLKRVKRLEAQKDLSEPSTSGQSVNHMMKIEDDTVREKVRGSNDDQYSSEEDVPLSQRTTKKKVQNEMKSPPKRKVQFKQVKQHSPTKRGPLTRSCKRRRLASSEESSSDEENSDSSIESSSSSSPAASEDDFTPKTRIQTRSARSAGRVRKSLRSRRRGSSNVIQSDDDDEEEPLKRRLRRSELKKKSPLPVKRKIRILEDEEEEEEKQEERLKEEKKEEEQKPPVLIKESENREDQLQEDQADKNQSKYYPGWEGELLQYKKKCRMPLQLIRVHKVSARRESPVLDKSASLKKEEDEIRKNNGKTGVKNSASSALDLTSNANTREEGTTIEGEQITKSEENSQDASSAANSRSEATPRTRLKAFRRRFRSGLDFIRKKKKPSTKKNNEEDVKANKNVKSNKSYVLLGATLDPATEIRSWVVNKSAGETVLHRAARLGYLEGVCYLLSRPETNVSVRDNAMYTPLHEAAAKGHLYVAKVLLMHGADESAAAKGGIRPLHEAVDNNHLEMVRLLLSYGADPRLATYAGLTPLALAKSNLEDEEEEEENDAEAEDGARKERSHGTQEKESKKMVDFLESHLKDVEGKPDLPFTFLGSASVMDESESGYNVLEACQITPEAETYVVFECSEFVLPQCYQLPSRTGKFVLLEELLQVRAGRTADSKQCQRLKSKAVCLTREEWNQVKEVAKIRPVSPVRDPVLMVPYDEEVREVLDIEEVVISSR